MGSIVQQERKDRGIMQKHFNFLTPSLLFSSWLIISFP